MQLKGGDLAGAIQLRLLRDKTRPLPAYLVNKAIWNIAMKAEKMMPVVLPAQMDAELNVSFSAPLVRGGKPSTDKKRQMEIIQFGNRSATVKDASAMNTAFRIVLARMNPKSHYNEITGHVWQLDRPDFGRGVGRGGGFPYRSSVALFWAWVATTAERMVRARHSSSGFYRLCATVIRIIFREAAGKSPVKDLSFIEGVAQAGSGDVSKSINRVAGATVATGEAEMASASFWVTATEPDTKGNRGDLFRVAQPVWQRGIDEESASIRTYAESLYTKAAQDSGIKVT